MADVPFTDRSAVIPVGGCDFAGITCYGSGRMFQVFFAPGGVHSLYYSANNGLDWILTRTYESEDNNWFWRAISPAPDHLLVGNEGPGSGVPGTAPDDAIARSTDGGVTWGSAFAPGFWVEDDFWDIMSFALLGNDEVIAAGVFERSGVEGHILRSTDNGATFKNPVTLTPSAGSIFGAGAAVYCGQDTVIVGVTMSNARAVLFRSIDRGATWTEIILPNTQHALAFPCEITGLCCLDGGVVLATGNGAQSSGNFPPRLWRSTDRGQLWTEITDSVPSWTSGQQTPGRDLVRLGPTSAVLSLSGQPQRVGGSHWRLTTDGGVTWTVCTPATYAKGAAVSHTPAYLGVGDNGTVANGLAAATAFEDRYLWAGVPVDVTDAAGACSGFAGAVTLGVHQDCVSAFLPAPCPQPCGDE